MEKIRIVFDGPPGPQSGRFIEVEDMKGKSFNAGEWRQISEDLWALEIPDFRQLQSENDALRERLARLVEAAERFEQVGWTQRGWEDCLQKLSIAIAAAKEPA